MFCNIGDGYDFQRSHADIANWYFAASAGEYARLWFKGCWRNCSSRSDVAGFSMFSEILHARHRTGRSERVTSKIDEKKEMVT